MHNYLSVQLTMNLYYKGGKVETTRAANRRRIILRSKRGNWQEAHLVAVYHDQTGMRVGSNRFICYSKEELLSALDVATEDGLIEFLEEARDSKR